MKLGQDQSLGQKQIISAQMIQTMEILRMSTVELEDYLKKLSLENPVIEISEKRPEEFSREELQRQRQMEWLTAHDRQNQIYYQNDETDDRENAWSDPASMHQTLQEYLHEQTLTKFYVPEEQKILDYIIQSLDERGYFTEDPGTAASLFDVSSHTILRMLLEVQKMDPPGVAARDLRECLVLQLHRKAVAPEGSIAVAEGDRQSELYKQTETIILFYLEELAKNHIAIIAKKMNIRSEDVVESLEVIRTLNPKPARGFYESGQLKYVRPDILVMEHDGEPEALLNESRQIEFSINDYYQKMEQTITDAAAREYLQEKLAQARRVEHDISQRESTLTRVTREVVSVQREFFLYGEAYKKPMQLSDLARACEIHESTVSRTLSSKYLQCKWGIFPLNYILTSVASVSRATGEAQTPEWIKLQMKKVIDEEDKKKPLSDEAISKRLEKLDIKISRRTVNKYRQEMNIPGKSGRKDWH